MRRDDRGFSYLALMVLIAILSMVAATAVQLGSIMERRSAETELLRIGEEFERALAAYSATTPVGSPKHPRELQDLLLDPRFPNVRRHLRVVRVDPVTHSPKWGLIRGPDGGIVAVHSLSTMPPIKIAGFTAGNEEFERAGSYKEWLFYEPGYRTLLNSIAPKTQRQPQP